MTAKTPEQLEFKLEAASFSVGLGLLLAGAWWLDFPDWDIGISFVMALSTLATAKWVASVVWQRRWAWTPLAIFWTWLSVDGAYWCTMPRTVHSAEFEEMPNHWSVRPLLSGNRACALHHRLLLAIGVLAVAACLPGCSSAPKAQDVVYGTTLPPQFGQFHHHPFFTEGCVRAARAQRGSNAQPIGPDVGSLLPSSNAILSSNLPDSAKLRCAQLLGHLRAVLANEEIKLRQNGRCISRSVEVNGRPQSTTRECVRAEDNAYPWTSVGWR